MNNHHTIDPLGKQFTPYGGLFSKPYEWDTYTETAVYDCSHDFKISFLKMFPYMDWFWKNFHTIILDGYHYGKTNIRSGKRNFVNKIRQIVIY